METIIWLLMIHNRVRGGTTTVQYLFWIIYSNRCALLQDGLDLTFVRLMIHRFLGRGEDRRGRGVLTNSSQEKKTRWSCYTLYNNCRHNPQPKTIHRKTWIRSTENTTVPPNDGNKRETASAQPSSKTMAGAGLKFPTTNQLLCSHTTKVAVRYQPYHHGIANKADRRRRRCGGWRELHAVIIIIEEFPTSSLEMSDEGKHRPRVCRQGGGPLRPHWIQDSILPSVRAWSRYTINMTKYFREHERQPWLKNGASPPGAARPCAKRVHQHTSARRIRQPHSLLGN